MSAHLLARLPEQALETAQYVVVPVDAAGRPHGRGTQVGEPQLPALVASVQQDDPACRWVWEDARISYPPLLRAGREVRRCHDLGLAGQAYATIAMYVVIIIVVIDMAFTWRGLKKRIVAKFGTPERGVLWYGTFRTMQMRFMRQPKAQVKRGADID